MHLLVGKQNLTLIIIALLSISLSYALSSDNLGSIAIKDGKARWLMTKLDGIQKSDFIINHTIVSPTKINVCIYPKTPMPTTDLRFLSNSVNVKNGKQAIKTITTDEMQKETSKGNVIKSCFELDATTANYAQIGLSTAIYEYLNESKVTHIGDDGVVTEITLLKNITGKYEIYPQNIAVKLDGESYKLSSYDNMGGGNYLYIVNSTAPIIQHGWWHHIGKDDIHSLNFLDICLQQNTTCTHGQLSDTYLYYFFNDDDGDIDPQITAIGSYNANFTNTSQEQLPYAHLNLSMHMPNITYYPSEFNVSVGTLTAGTTSSFGTPNDNDVIHIDETASLPAILMHFNISNAGHFDKFYTKVNYTGVAGHIVTFQLLDTRTETWNSLFNVINGGGYYWHNITIQNSTHYVNTENKIQGRVIHSSGGNPTHKLEIDALYVFDINHYAETRLYIPSNMETNKTIYDLSGYNNDGYESTGGTFSVNYQRPAKYGKGLNISRLDYVNFFTFNDAPSLDFGTSTDFTISAWVYLDKEMGFSEATIFQKQQITGGNRPGLGYHLMLNPPTNVTIAEIRNTAPFIAPACQITGSKQMNALDFSMITAVFTRNGTCDKNSIILYVNGTEDTARTATITTALPNINIDNTAVGRIGLSTLGGGRGQFDGIVDELMVLGTALTEAEVVKLYRNASNRFHKSGKVDFHVDLTGNNTLNFSIDRCEQLLDANLSVRVNDNPVGYINKSCNISGYQFTPSGTGHDTLSIMFNTTGFYTPFIAANLSYFPYYFQYSLCTAGQDCTIDCSTNPTINEYITLPTNRIYFLNSGIVTLPYSIIARGYRFDIGCNVTNFRNITFTP